MKAIKKIKNRLIRHLGGIPKEQLDRYCNFYYYNGKSRAYYEMIDEARKLYGNPSEEWCKTMYDLIAKRCDFNYELTKSWNRENTKSN